MGRAFQRLTHVFPFEDRHSRQRRLPEVGVTGQRKLGETSAVVGCHAGSDVEREYLLRSGFRSVTQQDDQPTPSFPWGEHFENDACRAVAHGAWAALAGVRHALGLTPRASTESDRS